MDNLLTELNYDFNFQVNLFNSLVENLRAGDKALAIAWLSKLKTITSSIQEARLRNDFLYYLVKNCTVGELRPPFREKPPKGTILNMISLLPPEARTKCVTGAKKKETRRAELFDRSPDKGAFLAAQPVPRCGCFCYLAVVSKPPEFHKDECN